MRLKRWLYILVGLGLVGTALYVLFGLFYTEFLVDLWWFQSLGYEGYFWQRLTYRYLVFGASTAFFFLVFFLNFWVASRFLGNAPPSPRRTGLGSRLGSPQVLQHFRRGSLRVYLPFSLLLAVLVAQPLSQGWEAALLYLSAPAARVADPVSGKDISYFLFALPVYLALFFELLIALVLLLLGLALLYWLESRALGRQKEALPRGARIHLSVLLLAIFALGVWGFLLERHTLLYSTAHAALFFGPGFTEMRLILPLIWLMAIFLAATGVALIFWLHARRGLKVLLVSAAVFALVAGARYANFLPEIVQKYIVKPNEISREKTFIANSIKATLAAYDLNRVKTREYRLEEVPSELAGAPVREGLRNIPVWDRDVLLTVYEQLQELRTYYHFTAVDVDRYTVNGIYQQVFLGARELNLKELPQAARNWVNEWLKYTHGYGVVMTPAAQGGEEPMTWFIEGIPPRSDYGFKIEQPAIYYGVGRYGPVIAPNDSHELGYPTEECHTLMDYQGRGGVPVNSFFRKMIFAFFFHEKDIFFTSKTNPRSHLLFRRNIVDRIRTVTPFFRLDKDPYMVVTPQGLFWLQDAYTVSDRYPNSQPYQGDFNYIRNSVKIVVDAYNGSVDYYVADKRDPIILAYQRIYPGLLKDLSQMPAALRPHLRYPKGIFDVQISIYAKYHQTDPETFYKQEDAWDFPEMQQGKQTVKMQPYYLTVNLLNPKKAEFVQLCPMTPKARANLRSLAVAGCDGDHYGQIVVYSFPKGALVYGPSQVDAFIDQDTVVSEQFTLWNQIGSQVERGKMLVLPVAGSIVYIQPVYLQAAARLKIPQLKRLIVSQGEMVIMTPSLEEGFAKLDERLKAKAARIQQRLQRLAPEKAPLASPQAAPPPAAPTPAPPAPTAPPAPGAAPAKK
jgi:uncharacterized membrane protein (UPF0182 family)